MDEVVQLIIDEKREEALKLLSDKNLDFADMFEAIDENEYADSYEIIATTRVAIRAGYISFNPANLAK